MGALFGSSDPGGAGAMSAQAQQMLMRMARQQWDIARPGVQNYWDQQIWQSGMSRELVPWLVQTFVDRYGGTPNVRYQIPGLSPESPGPGESAPTTPVRGPAPRPPGGGDVASVADQRNTGWRIDPFPNAPAPTPSPAPTPPPAPPPTPPPANQPQFDLPPRGGVGTFDTTLYDLERQIMEQSRTNIERFGRQNMDMLQQNLGSRFGISGASGSLAAGASAELAGKMNEQYIGAQQQVTSQMLGLQQAREAALAGIIMPMMGLDPSAVSWASANANQALQGSAQVGAQLAAQAAQRKQALWGSLLGLGQAFGAGAFGDLFSGGASYPIVGSTVPGTPPSYYNNPLNP